MTNILIAGVHYCVLVNYSYLLLLKRSNAVGHCIGGPDQTHTLSGGFFLSKPNICPYVKDNVQCL